MFKKIFYLVLKVVETC